nr:hypothetical protein [Tanacetum cinerariifolium]
ITRDWVLSRWKGLTWDTVGSCGSRRYKHIIARAMIELRADVELKDIIVVAMPKLVGGGSIRVLSVLSMSGNLSGVHVTPRKWQKLENAT